MDPEIIRPNFKLFQLSEVANALILYELGSIRTIPDHYNIREVYNFGCNTTPVVFVLPNDIQDPEAADGTKGKIYIYPKYSKLLSRGIGKNPDEMLLLKELSDQGLHHLPLQHYFLQSYGECSKISNTSCLPKFKRPRQTVQTQIRLLLQKSSGSSLFAILTSIL